MNTAIAKPIAWHSRVRLTMFASMPEAFNALMIILLSIPATCFAIYGIAAYGTYKKERRR